MSELPKPSPSAAVTVNYAPEFCVERLPRKTVARGCFVVSDSELRIKRIFTRPLSAVVSIANS